jgi:hypothetical protein
MITADSFEMVDGVTREWLERHPVWCPYDEQEDRPLILAWGVTEARLAEQIERLEYCGTQPLFPVLAIERLPEAGRVLIAADFVTASGRSLPGYVMRPHAFGLFAGDREFCFNHHLISASDRACEKLAAQLGEQPRDIFPLRYDTNVKDGGGKTLAGEIERFW